MARCLTENSEDRDVATVCRIVGAAGLALMIKSFGGVEIYIPLALKPSHPLTQLLGRERADALVVELGGDRIYLPLRAESRAAVVERMCRAGATVAEMVRATGISERRIYQIVAELRRTGRLPLRRQAKRAEGDR